MNDYANRTTQPPPQTAEEPEWHDLLAFRGSLVITPESIIQHAENLKAFAATVSVNGARIDGSIERFDDAQTLARDRNPRFRRITTVLISARADRREARLSMGLRPESVVLEARSDAEAKPGLNALRDRTLAEIKNTKTFYSAFWTAGRYVCRSKVLSAVLFLILFGCVAFWIVSAFQTSSRRDAAFELAKRELERSEHAPSGSADIDKLARSIVDQSAPSFSWFTMLTIAVGGYLVGFLIARIVSYLFPPVVFLVGEGSRRYEVVQRWRWFIVSAVPIGTFAVWGFREIFS